MIPCHKIKYFVIYLFFFTFFFFPFFVFLFLIFLLHRLDITLMQALAIHYDFTTVLTTDTLVCFAIFSYCIDKTACLAVFACVARYLFVYTLCPLVLLETGMRFAYASAIGPFFDVGWMFMTGVCKTGIASEFTVMTQGCFICLITIFTQVWSSKESSQVFHQMIIIIPQRWPGVAIVDLVVCFVALQVLASSYMMEYYNVCLYLSLKGTDFIKWHTTRLSHNFQMNVFWICQLLLPCKLFFLFCVFGGDSLFLSIWDLIFWKRTRQRLKHKLSSPVFLGLHRN